MRFSEVLIMRTLVHFARFSRVLARLCALMILASCFAVSGARAAAAESAKPNFVVFLADDLGYSDVPWHGSKYSMPHLDALSKQSLRLDAHYVHPMCSPTRAAFLSGRYASRFGCLGAQNERVYPFDQVTLAGALRSVGYATAITGKWHLGSRPDWGPNKFGFDESYGSLAGGVGPYAHRYKLGPYTETWHRNCELIQEEGHVTDLIAREAVKFVEKQSGEKPFFLYVPFTAVHIPITEPQEWLDKNKQFADEGERLHAACASHMDDAIGRVLAALDKRGLSDNTFVMFFSDNGGHDRSGNIDQRYPGEYPDVKVAGHNTPLRGFKSSINEGGIRSATLVRWPGHVKPGTQSDAPVHAADWMPTLTKIAGYQPAADLAWDGVDIGALLVGESTATPAREIYCLAPGGRGEMLRKGDWKLIVDRKGTIELYNLAADIGETKNLADEQPERVAQLRERLTAAAARNNDRITEETKGKTKGE